MGKTTLYFVHTQTQTTSNITQMAFNLLISILVLVLLKQYEARPPSSDVMDFLKRETCMEELGCFSAGSPFFDIVERPISLLPNPRESINTKFLLYNPSNYTAMRVFSNMQGKWKDILDSSFNPRADTKFIVPGFMSTWITDWNQPLAEALSKASSVSPSQRRRPLSLLSGVNNVFLVDWTGGDGPLYEQAVANTRVVGAEIALFIKHLQELTGIKPESVHIVGHSLGAHVAGYAGKRMKNLGRITAMDPAGPYFTKVDPVVRLDRKDALLVDAIHTNAAPTRFQGFGLTESIAHFDFYPNGGHLQPGCPDMSHAILSLLTNFRFDSGSLHDMHCNHGRAIELFTVSIFDNDCQLQGVICDSWENFAAGKCGSCNAGKTAACIPLGMHVDRYASMIKPDQSINVYLNTTATTPYCK